MASCRIPYNNIQAFTSSSSSLQSNVAFKKTENINPYSSLLKSFPNSSYKTVSVSSKRNVVFRALQGEDTVETQSVPPTEKEAWEMRKSEASEDNQQQFGSWEWTLNWNQITPQIIVGSCPRSPSDIDRMIDESGITAILNLQCDLCFEALKIPFDDIRARAMERSVGLHRVPIRDFDHGDQSLMLPEAVRRLNSLISGGNKVYVHCTAGINRATLTTVGYLTFVQGLALDETVGIVKAARPVAHPYIDCWIAVKKRLLMDRDEELTALAKSIYKERCAGGVHGTASTDWSSAQATALSRTFQRWLEVDTDALTIERELAQREAAPSLVVAQNALAEAHRVLSKAYKETFKVTLIKEDTLENIEPSVSKVPFVNGNGSSVDVTSAH